MSFMANAHCFQSVNGTNVIAVFQHLADKLSSLKTVKYRYSCEFNYPSENYVSKSQGDMYIDFDKENDLVGFRYQYINADGFSIFNNTEIFNGQSKEKLISVMRHTKPSKFEGVPALYNSIVTLRNSLPGIIRDKTIPKTVRDTVINHQTYYLLQFILHNRLLNYLGTGFTSTTKDLTFVYKIISDKKTYLPITFLQTNIGSKDLNRTDFMLFDTHPHPVSERSWYYSSYLDKYTLARPKKLITIIKTGVTAPDWQLTNYVNNTKETLVQYRGKMVLMEFWIKNCGYCIDAVPKLNKLKDTYSPDNLKILAINTEDDQKAIASFVTKNQVRYTVLYGDTNSINESYGIAAFPQVVLINKTGTVMYAGDFNMEKLKLIIDKKI